MYKPKPWDNEPTTMADKVILEATQAVKNDEADGFIVYLLNLLGQKEKRLRHAEKLLEQLLYVDVMTNDLEAHLEAAKKEDGK